jgi:hypothetical protein
MKSIWLLILLVTGCAKSAKQEAPQEDIHLMLARLHDQQVSTPGRYTLTLKPAGYMLLFDTTSGRVWNADPDSTNWTLQVSAPLPAYAK